MTTNLYTALAAANGELTNPAKDGTANYGGYATLAGTLDHVRPVLARHGLFVTQDVSNDDTHLFIRTNVAHASGEVLEFGPLTWPMVDKIQTLGGLVTYCRRYALMAALGLSGIEDDDDGQAANTDATRKTGGTPNPRNLRGPAARNLTDRATDKQVAMLVRLMREQKIPEPMLSDFAMDRLGFELPVDGIDHLTKGQASALIDALTKAPQAGRDYTPPGNETPPAKPAEPDDPWTLTDPATGEVAR